MYPKATSQFLCALVRKLYILKYQQNSQPKLFWQRCVHLLHDEGSARKFFSDNATNFVGAAHELQDLQNFWKRKKPKSRQIL